MKISSNRLAGKRFVPIRNDVERPRANNRADDQPGAEIHDLLRGNAGEQSAPASSPQPGQKCRRHHHTIPVDRERAELERNRMHWLRL